MNTNKIEKPFRVLSLGGGGIRGLYSAEFLNQICREQSKRRNVGKLDVGKGFDLIVGTSTGAIIACAAAIDCPMSKVVKVFKNHGSEIFPHRISNNSRELLYCFNRTNVEKGDKVLRRELTAVFKKLTLNDVYLQRGISMCIPSIRMSTHKAWVFKKTPTSGNRDDNYLLKDICIASSAAPIYRSLAAIKCPNSEFEETQIFTDGGLWANNPVLVALVEAINITNLQSPIEIYSLGTCSKPGGEYIDEKSVHRSMFDWKFGAEVVSVAMNAQELVNDDIARLLAGRISKFGCDISLIRFPKNEIQPGMVEYLGLDDTRKEAINMLITQAHDDVYRTLSACDDSDNSDGQKINALLQSLPTRNENTPLYVCD